MGTRKIVISPGFGAGWSTWADHEHQQAIAEWAQIVEAVEDGASREDILALVDEMIGELGLEYFYTGGVDHLRVVEVETPYKVCEYDGNEYVIERKALWT